MYPPRLLLPALALAFAPPLCAQSPPDAPPAYLTALVLLERGDTTRALDHLREATRTAAGFGPAFLRLGSILTTRAPELTRAVGLRREAEAALDRARRLLGETPTVLAELGFLRRKQHMYPAARWYLQRALRAAERGGANTLSAGDRARVHFELGLLYEAAAEDGEDLVWLPGDAEHGWTCGGRSGRLSFTRLATTCPAEWAAAVSLLRIEPATVNADRERAIDHFRRATAADPNHVEAAVRLAAHSAAAGDWDEVVRELDRIAAVASADPRTHLFRGMVLHRSGHDDEAAAAFDRALALLPPTDRRQFQDVAHLLPAAGRESYDRVSETRRAAVSNAFFATADPLLLTPSEELRLEHYARLAWAELWFGAPEAGLRGWETDRGRIFLRYGAPALRIQYRPAALTPERVAIWSYGPDGPNFVFRRVATHRIARLDSPSRALADHLARFAPHRYEPAAVTRVLSVPFQIARFRGPTGSLRFIVAAPVPLDSLEVGPADRLETGVFLVPPDAAPGTVLSSVTRAAVPAGAIRTRIDAPPTDVYILGIEARRAAADSIPRPLARVRETVHAPPFPEGRLSLSNLLLLDQPPAAGPPPTPPPVEAARPHALFSPGEPLHLFFEVYGLRPDAAGWANHRATLTLEPLHQPGILGRLRDAIAPRRDPPARLSWERSAPLDGGVLRDAISLAAPPLPAGDYVIRLQLTDPSGGGSAEARRHIRVRAAGVSQSDADHVPR